MTFTQEDQEWFVSTITSIVKTEFRVESARLDSRIDALDKKVSGSIDTLDEKLSERIERVETSLLTPFHKWSGPVDLRLQSHTLAIRALDLEAAAVKERLEALERGR